MCLFTFVKLEAAFKDEERTKYSLENKTDIPSFQ